MKARIILKLYKYHSIRFAKSDLVGSGVLFVFIVHLVPKIPLFNVFNMASAAILNFEGQDCLKTYKYLFIRFAVSELAENDPSFVFIAHLAPEITPHLFFNMASAAILDLEVKMIPKYFK